MASAQQVLLPQAFSSLPALPDFSSSPSALYPMLAFTFAALLLLALASWHCIVYPKVFSPLRHLPEPAVRFKSLLRLDINGLLTVKGRLVLDGSFLSFDS